MKRFIRSVVKSVLEVFLAKEVCLAKEEVFLAKEEVFLAKEEVFLAKEEVFLAKEEVFWQKKKFFDPEVDQYQLQHQHSFDKVGFQSKKLSAKKKHKFFHLVLQKNF